MPAELDDELPVLQASVERLRGIAEPLDAAQLRARAYPSEWNCADVVSHLASGAVMMQRGIDAALTETELADDFAQSVWAEWDAKTPEAKVADGLAADRALLERVVALTADERARVSLAFGPIRLDLAGAITMRINEHALHTWDIEVVGDATAQLPSDAVGLIVDNLGLIARFTGRAVGAPRDVHVRTTVPTRDFTLALGADAVSLEPCANDHAPDLELPAEALVRLVYGRLDPDHTPAVAANVNRDLDELRRVFAGV